MRPQRLLWISTALLAVAVLAFARSAQAFKLADSDQKSCFDTAGSAIPCTGTGQDGAYVANPMSLTDNNDGTITDNNSGLIWQKGTSTQSYTRVSAGTYCDSLVLAGASDWRLPSKKELLGFLEYDNPEGLFFPMGLPISSNYYWASTMTPDGGSAWHSFICWGNIDTALVHTTMSVRCVRGAETPGPVLATIDAATVADTRTGLTWQRGEPGARTWTDALAYCENLNLGGSTAWRLPNVKELESIVDVTKANPAVDNTVFPGATSANYWASTTHWSRNYAWRVDFGQGIVNGSPKTEALNVRCVSNYDPTAPSITAVSPASGTTRGGTPVTITGTNLADVTAVSFGGTPATAVTAVGSTSVTCTTPAGPAGAVDVVLTTPTRTATKAGAYTYTEPTITLSNNLVAEKAAAGTVIGTLSTSGGNVGDTYTYALTNGTGDTDNASFEIVGDQLRVLLALDFTVKNPYSIRVSSTDSTASTIVASLTIATPAYALWTRSDSGQAVLWQIDPNLPTGAAQLKRSVPLYSSSGIGAPWQATSYTHVSATQGYVLWTRSDTGRAVLWEIDPSLPTGAAQLKRSVPLYSSSGIGAPWQATSYTHVSATQGYVLWTRSDTGRAVLWEIDPSLSTGPEQIKRSVPLYSSSGIGASWLATSYTHVSATEGYVLWTHTGSWRAVLWRVDPSVATGAEQLKGAVRLYSNPGIETPWQATGYTHVSATEGYVLFSHSDTGRAVLWQIDPSLTGAAQITRAVSLYASSGVGAPWQVSSFHRFGPVTASSLDARDLDTFIDELPPTDIEPW